MAEQFGTWSHLTIADSLRLGRMIAVQKPNGGMRGFVAGDIEEVGGKDSRHASTPIRDVCKGRDRLHSARSPSSDGDESSVDSVLN